MPINVPPNQAMAMQNALAMLEEEKRKKVLGDFRSTHGGWYPNPQGMTYGASAKAMPKESAYAMLGAQNPNPALSAGRPVNAPQFAYVPPPGYESLVETPAASPTPQSGQALEEAPVNVPAPTPVPRAPMGATKASADNRKANARFREFMTTFGRR